MFTALKKLIYSVGQEEYVKSFDCGIAFVQIISIEGFNGSVKKIADIIKNIICESDEYYYILAKRPKKIKDLLKQRDKRSIERFNCNGILKIKIDIDSKTAIVQLYHDLIYDRSEKFNINQEIKSFIKDRLCQTPAEIFSQLEINNLNLTQKQCYY
ncbi:20629_t:CDS:2, partial [Rhizophagus irregularis]